MIRIFTTKSTLTRCPDSNDVTGVPLAKALIPIDCLQYSINRITCVMVKSSVHTHFVCMCVCVCVCVCVCGYTHFDINMCSHTCIHTHTHFGITTKFCSFTFPQNTSLSTLSTRKTSNKNFLALFKPLFNHNLFKPTILCRNTFAHLKINQYSTGLFVSYSRKNPNAQKHTHLV